MIVADFQGVLNAKPCVMTDEPQVRKDTRENRTERMNWLRVRKLQKRNAM
jgi:hypothetical protein